MQFDYWTARAVPQPMGITTIGVGVVVLDPRTGESQFKFKDAQRAFTGSESQEAIKQALQNLKTELEQLSATTKPLYLGDRYSLRDYLTFISSHWMNIIRVDKLRQEGGTLKYNDSSLEIGKDHLSVTAVALDPVTTAQRENYELFRDFCHDLNVTLISSSRVGEHAESLNRRLSA